MKFAIAIEPGNEDQAFGVVVPDLPGCFSAGDTFDEAIGNVREAIDLWCKTAITKDGGEIPIPAPLSEHRANLEYAGWVWATVEVPIERYFGPAEKVDITLPRRVLARVDNYAKAHGESRSGFLARAALVAMHDSTAYR
uniref:Predicted nuclease of the RNAse H fold, HicB family n=1 Tax=Candidatus Kentrum sp. UNK TaxID=2126344 RepID=A0A451AYJ3_9GAMM|nr:MAG: Predicted nuclease of the RNAse H fold, HicB family [Candidatus Kentron sp. UNK]VFK71118.1 MAG: Predicted nuclease of the RNAse H fold, HicB family [Candidatus Kentron sp. UNK]